MVRDKKGIISRFCIRDALNYMFVALLMDWISMPRHLVDMCASVRPCLGRGISHIMRASVRPCLGHGIGLNIVTDARLSEILSYYLATEGYK
ncbi:Retinal guanylyl cyclase 1 [Gossypium arboreum]|uniref:Retinal guanylyl cyclase 1 n=1 Tax=Gossypium arboreum TaxID=29729 RepID=A0A0B0MEW5_GOSAR|nr:Retinal guanylyl cyclase 1 [Gossypium arboreum]